MPNRLIAIEARGLGKRYRLGALEPYKTLRDEVVRLVGRRHSQSREERAALKELWAVRDVSLQLEQGEVLGIVGKNGAGKSTLLKILTRITRPTTGQARVVGRLGALLEVGTGFHLELTGRENIYMNGSILGMTRAEIRRKFDQIVDFSGVETFLDTPVKRYSSGMRVRLAFSVAAHLDPEILVIDEVLAVGDAAFQRKCLGRMSEVAAEGRTILFVSHQLEMLLNLCSRAVRFESGQLVDDGATEHVVNRYLGSLRDRINDNPVASRTDRSGDGFLRVFGIETRDSEGRILSQVRSGDTVEFVLRYRILKEGSRRSVDVRINLFDRLRRPLTRLVSGPVEARLSSEEKEGEFRCRIRLLPLPPGTYSLGFGIVADGTRCDKITDAWSFEVTPGDFFGTGQSVEALGLFLCQHQWDFESSR